MTTIKMHKVTQFALICSLIPLAKTYELPADCAIRKTVLTCQQTIPRELPNGIKKVYITDYTDDNIGQGRFSHSSWRAVQLFDINTKNLLFFKIRDHAFVGLDNITVLGIHGRKRTIIDEKAFVGIDRVEKLDFSNRFYLDSETLVRPLLYDIVLPNLRKLILENANTEKGNSYFKISQSFVDMLRSKNIKDLSLRGTNLLIEENASTISTRIEVLDCSNVSFLHSKDFKWDVLLPNLVTLNFSSYLRLLPSIYIDNKQYDICNDKNSLRTLKNGYANFCYHGNEICVNNVTINISAHCLEQINIVHIRGNNLHFVNATLHLPKNFPLYELDMSLNRMKYLSATFLKEMVNLKHLYLGDNLLSSMSNQPDFKILFKPLPRLKRLSMAHNQITYIPEQMFLHNLDLEWLDLQGNYLMSTSFMNLQLVNLMFLNISDNRIAYLVIEDLKKLRQMITLRNGSKFLEVKINGNPFECSCQSVDFIEWIYEKSVADTLQYQCDYEKEIITINKESIAKANFLCIRTVIYTISSVIPAAVALAIFVTLLLAWRYFSQKRRLTKLNKFLQSFQKGHLCDKFICMLSYSDTDAEVSKRLCDKLEEKLKDVAKCERDIVGIDYKHFQVGLPVVEEVMRCMYKSLVAVFVVSEAFCQSDWCSLEVREAYEQQKPIVLIFVEEVSEESMTLYVRNVFQRYTRGKLFHTEDGEVDFEPGGIKGLCDSIILLASGAGRDQRNVHESQA
ncbi:toll-like receptor 4 [Mercenaria mercenaria]|uniref:toll-like receptor 4 n=1 Tax=Mercenaria mercenaria TaxID=6596 RepID=UPI00234E95B7|nr:toll-like receptor 4 [Mercenaria mercenaria]